MDVQNLNPAIERIRHMEALFDSLQTAADTCTPLSESDLQTLVRYYESPLWRYDYELDAQGMLPARLKRGVLSEDGVYNFLDRILQNRPENY